MIRSRKGRQYRYYGASTLDRQQPKRRMPDASLNALDLNGLTNFVSLALRFAVPFAKRALADT